MCISRYRTQDGWARKPRGSGGVDFDAGALLDLLEERRVPFDVADDIDGARAADLGPGARRGGPEKDAEGAAGRPVPQIPLLHEVLGRRLEVLFHRDGE